MVAGVNTTKERNHHCGFEKLLLLYCTEKVQSCQHSQLKAGSQHGCLGNVLSSYRSWSYSSLQARDTI